MKWTSHLAQGWTRIAGAQQEVRVEVIEAKEDNGISESFTEKLNNLDSLIELHKVPKQIINSWLEKAQVNKINDLPEEKLSACIDYIEKKL